MQHSLPFSQLSLFLTIIVILLFGQIRKSAEANVHIIPHFTSLPASVSHFIPVSETNGDNSRNFIPVELVCRAWPPNAKLFFLAAQLNVHPISSQNLGLTNSLRINSLLPLPQSLGTQRYGVLTAAQLLAESGETQSLVKGLSPVSTTSINSLINHETLVDVVRERPAAAPNDEVAIRLILSTPVELSQLELLRLHCLAASSFGRILSAPFRVVPASLGTFPSIKGTSSSSVSSSDNIGGSVPLIKTVEFLRSNIAIVDCYMPLNSFPKPIIEFELNNTILSISSSQTDKYRQVYRLDGKRVSLLIQNFQPRDCGIYRCLATNPLTKEKRYSPEAVNVRIQIPGSPVASRIRVPLAMEASIPRNPSSSKEIVVHEGQNITLFCIIQSAPPPTVVTYPFDQNFTSHDRFQKHIPFGLLEITNVQPEDAGIYICSDHQLSSTAQLLVIARLRISIKPEDVRITQFGETVQFRCTSSDQHVSPYWLFNGQLKTTGIGKDTPADSTLTITNVTRQELGIYQCVAHRRNIEDPYLDEWVSAYASLIFNDDRVIRTAKELSMLIPPKPPSSEEISQDVITDSLTPSAEPVYDNLAIYITWKPFKHDSLIGHLNSNTNENDPASNQNLDGTSKPGQSQQQVSYQIEYSMQVNPIEHELRNSGRSNSQNTSLSDSEKLQSSIALIGLIGHEAVRWSDPVALNQQSLTTYAYITGDPLEPSKRYRFRVIAIDSSTGLHLAPPSGWSNIVSMEHISAVDPPQIKVVRPLSEGRIQVVWQFGSSNINDPNIINPSALSSKLIEDKNLASSSSISSSLMSSTSNWDSFLSDESTLAFVPDYFLILARPVIKPKRGTNVPIEYGAYWAAQVNGSQSREGLLTGLNNTANYQIIVYGVRGSNEHRQITRFSKAVYVNMASSDYTGRYNLLDTLANNRLMYIILGAIAALMFLVMFILILLCLCRQHHDRRSISQRKKQNGYIHGYKDPKDFRPTTTTDGVVCNPNGTNAGQASRNGSQSVVCSNVSTNNDDSASVMLLSNPSCHPQQQQQQHNELQHQLYMQQQQVDQYNAVAAAAAMSNELFQQQRQAMLGSQLQLHQQAHLGNQPYHHQSHHSLLLPSGANSNSLGPGMVPPAMFHSGTLPGGPRYLRQVYGTQFRSQQPLNRSATSPVNTIEMTDFCQQQQPNAFGYQQPQLPQLPHPQSANLPPAYPPQMPLNNGTMNRQLITNQNQQTSFYTGPVTPSGSSLKREPPTGAGGSVHDGSGYGTLLQRGQLTASMIVDSQNGMNPLGVYPAVYYRGSQQALHMYPNGMSTPHQQQQQATFYQSQQQQQQQQQALYVQHQLQQQQHQAQMHPGYFSPQLQGYPDTMVDGSGNHGFGHTDGESIYSYFSQHDMSQPQMGPHQHLNPLPEENQLNSIDEGQGSTDPGHQTTDGNAADNGSPTNAGGSHRHHRRRRRKQQQQERVTGELASGSESSKMLNNNADPEDGVGHFSNRDSQLDVSVQKRQNTMSPGPYLQNHPDGMIEHHRQQPNQTNTHAYTHGANGHLVDPNLSHFLRYDSPPLMSNLGGQLPPPNQPPPPPPAVAMGFRSANMNSIVNGNTNFLNHEHHNSLNYSNHQYMHDPLAHRTCSPPSCGGGGGYSSNSGAGLLVGPPPRIRDYSEYGIPRGIGLPPPTLAGGQPLLSQHNVLMTSTPTNGPMFYEEHYHDGQA